MKTLDKDQTVTCYLITSRYAYVKGRSVLPPDNLIIFESTIRTIESAAQKIISPKTLAFLKQHADDESLKDDEREEICELFDCSKESIEFLNNALNQRPITNDSYYSDQFWNSSEPNEFNLNSWGVINLVEKHKDTTKNPSLVLWIREEDGFFDTSLALTVLQILFPKNKFYEILSFYEVGAEYNLYDDLYKDDLLDPNWFYRIVDSTGKRLTRCSGDNDWLDGMNHYWDAIDHIFPNEYGRGPYPTCRFFEEKVFEEKIVPQFKRYIFEGDEDSGAIYDPLNLCVKEYSQKHLVPDFDKAHFWLIERYESH